MVWCHTDDDENERKLNKTIKYIVVKGVGGYTREEELKRKTLRLVGI